MLINPIKIKFYCLFLILSLNINKIFGCGSILHTKIGEALKYFRKNRNKNF